MFKITYLKTGKTINLDDSFVYLALPHKKLVELGFKVSDLREK